MMRRLVFFQIKEDGREMMEGGGGTRGEKGKEKG
jgi:hypothetical protein